MRTNMMKRAWILMAILAWTTSVLAQQAQQTKPAQAAQPGQSAQPAAPGTAAQPAPLPGRRPQPKSKEELEAYKKALASSDPAALEKAADDFSTQYPDSQLTPLLYREAMHNYERQGDGAKVIEAGEKVLKADPDDPEALVVVAQHLVESPGTGADSIQRLNQAMKYAQHAIETADTDYPGNLPPDKVDTFKSVIKSDAYSIVGTLQYNMQEYADAEGSFRKSIDAFPSQPDAVVELRLAMALEKQGKYPDALKAAKQAVDLTQENTGVGQMARKERDRLEPLARGGNAAPASSTPKQ
jgi:tetratricopeptide (TPR) repeat protein